eukprot:CAMPEP_0113574692 /NCGR_PEP_ID=MMETSP0015_2-20120614/27283_1 /TAXON_ID=2838 /ORGANISM="Odontella" /LENGTH=49 /DNA_ID=CAMNT_0000477847 /DNA_START=825 /DNA_END=971 /DNA_ORIENTATION=+ /assembly_acc=CAM_ASM_000160
MIMNGEGGANKQKKRKNQKAYKRHKFLVNYCNALATSRKQHSGPSQGNV